MKLYVAMYDDFTIGDPGTHVLGIYDTKEAAEKRADEYFKEYIKSDDCGPLGNTWVIECDLNKKWPGSAIEAAYMEEEKNG